MFNCSMLLNWKKTGPTGNAGAADAIPAEPNSARAVVTTLLNISTPLLLSRCFRLRPKPGAHQLVFGQRHKQIAPSTPKRRLAGARECVTQPTAKQGPTRSIQSKRVLSTGYVSATSRD